MKNLDNVLGEYDEEKLKQAFMDACSNKEFKKYLDLLNIEEELLMKYTSLLEDAYKEFEHCKKCKGLEYCLNEMTGYLTKPEKQFKAINFTYVACKYKKEEIEEKEYINHLSYYNMPSSFEKASFKEIYKDDKARVPVVKYFKEFIDLYTKKEPVKGIYLNGSFGSGKTYLISALFNEMAKKKVECALVYYPELLRDLKASFNDNYKEKFNSIMKSPLLLLDDIGAENSSAWSRDEVLGPILQYRMDYGLPTFFTSNLTLEELEKNLSTTNNGVDSVKARRIIERIKQLTTSLDLISKNRRN